MWNNIYVSINKNAHKRQLIRITILNWSKTMFSLGQLHLGVRFWILTKWKVLLVLNFTWDKTISHFIIWHISMTNRINQHVNLEFRAILHRKVPRTTRMAVNTKLSNCWWIGSWSSMEQAVMKDPSRSERNQWRRKSIVLVLVNRWWHFNHRWSGSLGGWRNVIDRKCASCSLKFVSGYDSFNFTLTSLALYLEFEETTHWNYIY